MVKILSFVLFFLAASTFFLSNVYAQTIIQGSAQDNTSITTHIEGSGSVHTHIESTVNGNTKVLDSNKPGTYTLNNSGPSTPSEKPTVTVSPTPKHEKIVHTNANLLSEAIKSFLQRIAERLMASSSPLARARDPTLHFFFDSPNASENSIILTEYHTLISLILPICVRNVK